MVHVKSNIRLLRAGGYIHQVAIPKHDAEQYQLYHPVHGKTGVNIYQREFDTYLNLGVIKRSQINNLMYFHASHFDELEMRLQLQKSIGAPVNVIRKIK